MNTRHLIIALALTLSATSGTVLAQNAANQASQVQGKTRAQVIAELKQARADGTLSVSDYDYPKLPEFHSTKSREQVIAELKQARADGTLAVGDYDYPKLPEFKSSKSRTQVVAELQEYNKNPDPQGLYRGY